MSDFQDLLVMWKLENSHSVVECLKIRAELSMKNKDQKH